MDDSTSLPGNVTSKDKIDVLRNDINLDPITLVSATHGQHGTVSIVELAEGEPVGTWYHQALSYSISSYKTYAEVDAIKDDMQLRIDAWKAWNTDRINDYYTKQRTSAGSLRDFMNSTPDAFQAYLQLAANFITGASSVTGALGTIAMDSSKAFGTMQAVSEVVGVGLSAIVDSGGFANADLWFSATELKITAAKNQQLLAMRAFADDYLANLDSLAPQPLLLTTDIVTYKIQCTTGGEESRPITLTVDLGGKLDYSAAYEFYKCEWDNYFNAAGNFPKTNESPALPTQAEVDGSTFYAFAKSNGYPLTMYMTVSRSTQHGPSVYGMWGGASGNPASFGPFQFLRNAVSDKIADKLNDLDWHRPSYNHQQDEYWTSLEVTDLGIL